MICLITTGSSKQVGGKDMIEQATKGIGAGIGIAAIGIGAGIAFDSMRNIKPKKSYTMSYSPPKFKPFKFKI
jgi:hypothetical protein